AIINPKEILKKGAVDLDNINEPKTREVTPPAVRTPKVGVYISKTKSTIPNIIRMNPP
ncbi:unnamed protein product, partial [marine sediment metagenome]